MHLNNVFDYVHEINVLRRSVEFFIYLLLLFFFTVFCFVVFSGIDYACNNILVVYHDKDFVNSYTVHFITKCACI